MAYDDFEVEDGTVSGAGEAQWVDTGDEPDIGQVPKEATRGKGKKRMADVRGDPAVLFAEVKANDWRSEATTNAEGLNHPAVAAGGEILFFDPVPQGRHSNFAGDAGGARAPWPFRAVRMGLELLCPPTPTSFPVMAVGPAYDYTHFFPSHSQMWADIITRGTFWMEYADIPILKGVPVSQIGCGGGAFHSGDSFGSAQNGQPQWDNAFKLPDELIMAPGSNASLKARILLNPSDLAKLGVGDAEGWGQPMAPSHKITYVGGEVPIWGLEVIPVQYRGIRLNFWGQRLLNIRAGRGSISQAAASNR